MRSIMFCWSMMFLLVSCNSSQKDKVDTIVKTSDAAKTKGTDCSYRIAKKSVQVNWTAFKTTKKVAVNGTFNEVTIDATSNVSAAELLIPKTTFIIHTSTVNSNKPERDLRLVELFFAKFSETDISGVFKTSSGDNGNGGGIVEISMNGFSKDTPYTYRILGNNIEIVTSINIDSWNGQAAIVSLNKACRKLHAGEDGISKTWKDIEVKVIVPMLVDCK